MSLIKVVLDGTEHTGDGAVPIGFSANIVGTGAAEWVTVQDSTTDLVFGAGNGDAVDLPLNLSDYIISASGNQLTLTAIDTENTIVINVTGTSTLQFADGDAALSLAFGANGPQMNLGGAVILDGETLANYDDVFDDEIIANPGNLFTLQEVVVGQETIDEIITTIDPVISTEVYWGYNPHGHDETGVDNTADPNSSNLTNEGPLDGGVPLSVLMNDVVLPYLAYNEGIVNLFNTVDTLDEIKGITIAGGTANGNSLENTAVAEEFALNLDPGMEIIGSDTVTFDGVTVDLVNLNTGTAVATAIAAGAYPNWYAVADGNVVTFTNKTPGSVVDVEDTDFVFTDANLDNVNVIYDTLITTQGDDAGGETNDVDDNPYTGTYDITIELSDGSTTTAQIELTAQQFEFINGLLFDDEGNSRLYEVETKTWPQVELKDANGDTVLDADGNPVIVDLTQVVTQEGLVTNVYEPIVLTTTANNGGTHESGFTSDADDTIVAGRLDLLHQAYIDGGAGWDTLEIDAKGYFAQPLELINIEQVNIENLPNVYTYGEDGNVIDPFTYARTTGDFSNLADALDANQNSVIDLTRATSLEKLVVTESLYDGLDVNGTPGSLTVTGVRANAVATFEGSFTQNVTVNYGEGLDVYDDGISIVLRLGEVATNATLGIAHNAATLNIDSQGGGNVLDSASLGNATLMNLNISGDARLVIDNSLHHSFSAADTAIINAFANTARVDLNMDNFTNQVDFTGTLSGNDRFSADNNTADTTVGVIIQGGNGDNQFSATGASNDVQITTGDGANQIDAGSAEDVTVTVGNGNNEIDAVSDSKIATITVGDGDNRIESENGHATVIVTGDGNNTIDTDGTNIVNITTAVGDDSISSINSASVTIDAGDGDNTIVSSAEVIDITTGIGNDEITLAGRAGAGAGVTGSPNVVLVLDGSGSMFWQTTPPTNAQAQADAVDNLLNILPDDTAIYVVYEDQGTNGVWASKAEASAIANGLADGTISGTWDTSGFITQTEAAFADQTGTYNAGGANEVIFITDGANSGPDEAAWIDFLVANDVRANTLGIGVIEPSDIDVVNSLSYDGRANSDLDGILAPTNDDLSDLLEELGNEITVMNGNGAVINIDLGDGENVLNLGDAEGLAQGLVALEGSSITGENITLVVDADSDLRAATLTGITSVVLDNADVGSSDRTVDNAVLTLTDVQFMEIGAENFSVEGSIFYTYSQVEIIITDDRSLTDLGVDSLASNIDLRLQIEDGNTLTMTAQQLHENVAPQGVTLADDGNTDELNGSVVIEGGGQDFDPFNEGDFIATSIAGTEYVGGSLSSDFGSHDGGWFNVDLQSVYHGYDRPADVPAEVVFTINGDMLGGDPVGEFSTWHYNLDVVGAQDVAFTGEAISLGMIQGVPTHDFTVDFSTVEGNVTGLTLANFEMVAEIHGNGLELVNGVALDPVRIDVEVAGDVASNLQGLVTTGVQSYVVTDTTNFHVDVLDAFFAAVEAYDAAASSTIDALIAAYEAVVEAGYVESTDQTIDADYVLSQVDNVPVTIQPTVYLSNVSQDVVEVGLQGNYDGGINFVNLDRHVDILLEGSYDKYVGNAVGNVGVFYARANAIANITIAPEEGNVLINEPILVHSVNLGNVSTANFTLEGHEGVVIQGFDGNNGDSGIEALNLTGDGYFEIESTLPVSLTSVDASGAVDFTATMAGELPGEGLTFVAATGTTLLTLDEVTAGHHSSFSAEDGATFNLVIEGDTDLSAATLSNVDTISLTDESVVSLTMDQIADLGQANIVLAHPGWDGAVHVTDLDGDLFDSTAFGEGVDVEITLDQGAFTLDPATDLTNVRQFTMEGDTEITFSADQLMDLATSLVASNADLADLADLFAGEETNTINITGLTQAHADWTIEVDGTDYSFTQILEAFTDNSWAGTITLAESVNLTDSESLDFEFILGDGMTLGIATEDQADGLVVTGGVDSTVNLLFAGLTDLTSIDASEYDVTTLMFQDLLVADQNIDAIFTGLNETIIKEIYNNAVALIDQTVTVSATTTVRDGGLALDRLEPGLELEDVIFNLEGGTVIEGGIDLSVGAKADDLIQTYLKTVTINSTGTEGNIETGDTANIVEGSLTSQGVTDAGDNNLLSLTINADQDLVIGGGVVFESVINDDQTAVLTVNGEANVTLGALDTLDEDVDGLDVINNGTGILTVTLDGDSLDDGDALSFTGTGPIVLSIANEVDLSDDDLAAVVAVNLEDESDLTLTMDQADIIGAANFSLAEDDTATLTLAGLNDQEFALANYDVDGTLTVTITLADDEVVTLHPDTDLTGITSLEIPEGTTLVLTAAQFQQLDGAGTITSVDDDPDATANIHIIGMTQADIDVEDGFSTAGIDIDGDIEITIVEDVDLSGETLTGVDIFNLGDDMTLTLGDITVADGVEVIGGVNSTLKFTDLETVADEFIDASGFDVTTLMFTNMLTYDGNLNVDDIFSGLSGDILKVVYVDEGSVVTIDQVVTIEPATINNDSLEFNPVDPGVELSSLTLNMMGGSQIDGDLGVPTGDKFLDENDDGIQDAGEIDLMRLYLQALVINSEGTAVNPITGETANIITGDITPGANNNLLNVTINATQDFILEGDVIFNSNVGGDDYAVNDIEDAMALITINATADVTLGTLDTTDGDVDGLTVDHSGDGALSFTLMDDGDEDAIIINGSATGTTHVNVDGNLDLSDDTLVNVDVLTMGDADIVTLTQAQMIAIGVANITVNDENDAAQDTGHLVINEFDGSVAFDSTALQNFGTDDATDDIMVVDQIIMADGEQTLDPATDLSNVAQITVAYGGTLNLTAAQYMQLIGNSGTIVTLDEDGDVSNVADDIDATVNITDLMQADVADVEGGDPVVFTTVPVSSSIVLNLTLAEDVDLDANEVLTGLDELFIPEGLTLGLATSIQADELNVTGLGAVSTVAFRFMGLGADGAGAPVLEVDDIDVSGYDISNLRAMGLFIGGENVEFLLEGLDSDVQLDLVYDPDALGIVDPTNRIIVVEPSVTVDDDTSGIALELNDLADDAAVETLHLTLQGQGSDPDDDEQGAVVNGDINLSTVATAVGLEPLWFESLTIVSEGTGEANRINGDITPMDPGHADHIDNDLLDVSIEATHDLVITGDIVFNVADPDKAAAVDDDNDADVTLTISGTAPVELGGYVATDADIDSVTITSTNTAEVTLELDADSSVDADTTLAGGAGGFALIVTDDVDGGPGIDVNLSPADISGINSLHIGHSDSATLTIDQLLNTIGVANITGETDSVINIGMYEGEAIDAPALEAAGVNVGTITFLENDGATDVTYTVDPAADFTGVAEIIIPEGVIVNMTADQFQQLDGIGLVSGDGMLNLTDLGNAHGDIDLSGVTAENGTISLDAAEAAVILSIDGDVAEIGDFAIELTADDQSVTFSSHDQADGRTVDVATGITGTMVVIGYLAPATQIVTTDYDPALQEIRVYNELVADQNVENLLFDLASAIDVVIFKEADDAPVDAVIIESTERNVYVEEDVTVDGDLIFNDLRMTTEVTRLTLNLEGGVDITGDVELPTVEEPEFSEEGILYNAAFLGDVIIDSYGDTPNSMGRLTAGAEGDLGANETFSATFTANAGPVGTVTFDGVEVDIEAGASADDVRDAVIEAITEAYNAGETEWTAANGGAGIVDFEYGLPANVEDVVDADFVFDGATSTAVVGAVINGAAADENQLLDVIVQGSQDVDIAEIEFSSRSDVDDEAVAELTVTNTGATVIGDLDTDDDDVDALVVNHTGTGDLTVGLSSFASIDATDAITINGSATGMDTLVISGEIDLSDDTLVNVDAIELNNGDLLGAGSDVTTLTLTTTQALEIGLDNVTAIGEHGEDEVLVINAYAGENLDSTLLLDGVADEIGLVILVDDTDGLVVVDPAANLSNVLRIEVPEGTTLQMTADQFESLPAGLVIGDGTLNLTHFDSDNGDIDLSTVTAMAGTITLDPAAGEVLVNQAAILNGSSPVADDGATADVDEGAVAKTFDFIYGAEGQSLTVSSEDQAEGFSGIARGFDGSGFTETTLLLGYEDNINGPAGALRADGDYVIDASEIDVSDLLIWDVLAENINGVLAFGSFNPEVNFTSLAGDVTLTIYDPAEAPAPPVDAEAIGTTARVVVIDEETTVTADFVFDDERDAHEVATLDLTFADDSVLEGNLDFRTTLDLDVDEFALYFRGLTINSEGTAPNAITGSITAGGANVAESFTLTLDAGMVVADADTIEFDGVLVTLADGDTEAEAGDKLADAINAAADSAWSAVSDGAGAVAFAARIAGENLADPVIGDFDFTDIGGASANLTGAVAGNADGADNLENNLLNVTINADNAFSIDGSIDMSYARGSILDVNGNPEITQAATLTVTGDSDVNIGSVDTSDADVTGLTVVTAGYTGTLTAPGTSPALDLDNTATLVFTGSGDVYLGTGDENDRNGIAGDALESINASLHTGILSLGVIDDITEGDFTFTGGTGLTTLTLGDDDDADGDVVTMAAGSDWVFDLSTVAAGSVLTFTGNLVLPDLTGADTTAIPAQDIGRLAINLGANGTLRFDGNVDFRSLVTSDGVNRLDLSGVAAFELAEGAVLQMTQEQWDDLTPAQQAAFTGDGRELYIDGDNADWFGAIADLDISDVRGVTSVQIEAVDADGNGTGIADLALTSSLAAITTTYDATDGAEVEGDAGDFTAFTGDVDLDVDGAANISGYLGLTTIDVIPGMGEALTVRNTQLGELEAGDFTFADDFEETSGLTISAQTVTGFDFDTGDPILGGSNIVATIVTRDIDNNITDYTVTGRANAIANSSDTSISVFDAVDAADETVFDAFLAGASAVTHTFVGSEASIRNGDGEGLVGDRPLAATDTTIDTFQFIANTVDVVEALADNAHVWIDSFNIGEGDVLDFSAFMAADPLTFTLVTAQITGGADSGPAQDIIGFDLNLAVGDEDDPAAIVAAFATGGVYEDGTGNITFAAGDDQKVFLVTDGIDSAIWHWDDTSGASDDGIVDADEIVLIGYLDNIDDLSGLTNGNFGIA